jgi:predicted methyltransferase
MRSTERFLILFFCCLVAVVAPGIAHSQEHQHQELSSDELARLNAEWDQQYADYQRKLAGSSEVQPGMIVADLGAGRGGLTAELSRAVGPAGQVYANDIDPRMIAALGDLCRKHKLDNVTVIEGAQNDPKLPPERVEAAFLLKVYHQLEDAVGFLKTTREQLKSGALLFIVDVDVHQDWGQGKGSVSDPADCQRDAVAAGFEIVRLARFPIVDWMLYELVVRKPRD